MKFVTVCILGCLLWGTVCQAASWKNDFSDPELEVRQALRGDWKIGENVAFCVADPELFVKYNKHGPILRWPSVLQDGIVELEFRAEGCERVIIYLNNEIGHVMRVMIGDEKRTGVFGWPGRSKGNPSILLAKEGVPSAESVDGKWVKVRIAMKGDTCEIQVGDYFETLTHDCMLRAKEDFSIGFAGGALSVRSVEVLSQ